MKLKPAALTIGILRGSWDLVTGVIIMVTTLITPLRVLITVLTKSHDPPSKLCDYCQPVVVAGVIGIV